MVCLFPKLIELILQVYFNRLQAFHWSLDGQTHLDSFLLFINPAMIRKLVHHMEAEARWFSGDQFDFDFVQDEFLAFLGIVLAPAVLCGKNEPLDALWSQDYGCDIFWHNMARNRFCSITHHTWFDDD